MSISSLYTRNAFDWSLWLTRSLIVPLSTSWLVSSHSASTYHARWEKTHLLKAKGGESMYFPTHVHKLLLIPILSETKLGVFELPFVNQSVSQSVILFLKPLQISSCRLFSKKPSLRSLELRIHWLPLWHIRAWYKDHIKLDWSSLMLLNAYFKNCIWSWWNQEPWKHLLPHLGPIPERCCPPPEFWRQNWVRRNWIPQVEWRSKILQDLVNRALFFYTKSIGSARL